MSETKKELLSEIAHKAGYIYISDLSLPNNIEVVTAAARTIERNQYTIQEWCDAMQYIFGKDAAIESMEQLETLLNA